MASTPRRIAAGTAGGGTTLSQRGLIVFPSDVSVSDLALLVLATNATTGTITVSQALAWTESMVPGSAPNSTWRFHTYQHICNGTEANKTITVSVVITQFRWLGNVFIYRGDANSTWKYDVNGATTGNWVASGSLTSVTCVNQGISCSGNNRLILNFWWTPNNFGAALSLSAATGAIWTPGSAYVAGGNLTLQDASASLTQSGSISNGIGTQSLTSNSYAVFGTAIWTSAVSTQQTITPAGDAATGSFGVVPIVIPFGAMEQASYAREMWPW